MNGGMNETTTAKKEKTYVNYLSEKKRNKAIYAMLPYYENVIILGDSLAESILDYSEARALCGYDWGGYSAGHLYGSGNDYFGIWEKWYPTFSG